MIREALESDMQHVDPVIQSAFASVDANSNDQARVSEISLVHDLIMDGDVLLNLISETAGEIVGHVMVSSISLESDESLYGGGALMCEIINRVSQLGLDVLFLFGDPAYYSRFDFKVSGLANEYGKTYFQELQISEGCLVGLNSKVSYAPAFSRL